MFDCKRPDPHCSPVRASHRKVKAKVEVEGGHYRGGIDLWSTFSSVSTLLPQATNFPPLNLSLNLNLLLKRRPRVARAQKIISLHPQASILRPPVP
jgi:hypothetical protein